MARVLENTFAGIDWRTARRIVVIGPTGSGKSTLSAQMAQRLGVPLIELDDLFWLPAWQSRPKDVFQGLVDAATTAPAWVVCGNYQSSTQDIVWPRADVIVWLDYPFPVVAWRSVTRAVNRVWTGRPICNGNRESLLKLFSGDSILLWLLKTFWRHRERTRAATQNPLWDKLCFVHLTNVKTTRESLSLLS